MPLLNAAIVVFIVAISAAVFGFPDFATNAILVATILVGIFLFATLIKFVRLKLGNKG